MALTRPEVTEPVVVAITRVFGTLPLGDSSLVDCTVYIEGGQRDDPDPPAFVSTGLDICGSMRVAPTP